MFLFVGWGSLKMDTLFSPMPLRLPNGFDPWSVLQIRDNAVLSSIEAHFRYVEQIKKYRDNIQELRGEK